MSPQSLQGRRHRVGVSLEGVLLLIPGRPQARLRNGNGKLLEAGHAYFGQVRLAAKRQLACRPAFPAAHLPLKLELYYAFTDELAGELLDNPVKWHLHSIPTTESAPSIILSGLTGLLYTHVSQVEPLTVSRIILSHEEIVARFGKACRRGCAVVRWRSNG